MDVDSSKSILIGDKLTDASAVIDPSVFKNILLKADDKLNLKINNYLCVLSLLHSEINL